MEPLYQKSEPENPKYKWLKIILIVVGVIWALSLFILWIYSDRYGGGAVIKNGNYFLIDAGRLYPVSYDVFKKIRLLELISMYSTYLLLALGSVYTYLAKYRKERNK